MVEGAYDFKRLLIQDSVPRVFGARVYRGQVISLWTLISKYINYSCHVYGISPFSSAADEVSHYASGINYYDDVLKNFNYFQLPLPNLVKSFSTDSLALDTISSREWDLIYIDGSH
ncbi:MAG: hypothetical protein ACKPKW_24320, partial [Dolichospermum sp.]